MSECTTKTVYFDQPGKGNTGRTLELAYARAKVLGITQVIVATTGGETAVRAAQLMKGMEVIAVTHPTCKS